MTITMEEYMELDTVGDVPNNWNINRFLEPKESGALVILAHSAGIWVFDYYLDEKTPILKACLREVEDGRLVLMFFRNLIDSPEISYEEAIKKIKKIAKKRKVK